MNVNTTQVMSLMQHLIKQMKCQYFIPISVVLMHILMILIAIYQP